VAPALEILMGPVGRQVRSAGLPSAPGSLEFSRCYHRPPWASANISAVIDFIYENEAGCPYMSEAEQIACVLATKTCFDEIVIFESEARITLAARQMIAVEVEGAAPAGRSLVVEDR